jgi:hypothetical protein
MFRSRLNRVGRVVPDEPFCFPNLFSREENEGGEGLAGGNRFVSFETFARHHSPIVPSFSIFVYLVYFVGYSHLFLIS